jgi:hypothetical protein
MAMGFAFPAFCSQRKIVMRRTMVFLGMTLAWVFSGVAQDASSPNLTTKVEPDGRRMTAPAVVERGAHHKVWQRFEIEAGPDGKEFRRPRQYTEIGSGMHYLEEGQWKETRE